MAGGRWAWMPDHDRIAVVAIGTGTCESIREGCEGSVGVSVGEDESEGAVVEVVGCCGLWEPKKFPACELDLGPSVTLR